LGTCLRRITTQITTANEKGGMTVDPEPNGRPARGDERSRSGEAFRTIFERTFTYWNGVARNFHRFASAPALSSPDEGIRWSYAELGERVARLAAGLVDAGVGPGDVVVHQLTNSPEFVLTYLACHAIAAVSAPINYRLSSGEIAAILDDSQPKAYIFEASQQRVALEALQRARSEVDLLVQVGRSANGASSGVVFADLADHALPERLPGPAERSIYDEVTRLYTSGTTGLPKGVPLTSVAEVLSAHDVIMHFPLSPDDRTLNMTPWFHRGGLHSGGPCPTLYVGGEVVALRRFDPAVVLDWVETLGLTFLIGAPTTLAMLAEAQESKPRDLTTLRGIVTMGAPLEREACLRYQRVLTPRIFNGYGTTEAFWNTFLRPSDLPAKAGTAGRACTDDDVVVARLHDDRLPSPSDLAAKDGSELGEVAVRSPKAAYAYVGNPEEEALRYRDGWLFIGDLATWDADEYLTIVGRRDDMIISGGENIHPVQVEEVLSAHPGVKDAAVVGLPDETWGEMVVAYVVRSDPSVDAEALEAFCRDNPSLAGYKRPRAYAFVDELPLTATGKKQRYVLRAQTTADDQAGRLHRPTSAGGTRA